jgi:hypothetical protein
MSRRPALGIRTSALVMPCLDLGSSTALKRSVSEVESILTMMSLLASPTVTAKGFSYGFDVSDGRDDGRVRAGDVGF